MDELCTLNIFLGCIPILVWAINSPKTFSASPPWSCTFQSVLKVNGPAYLAVDLRQRASAMMRHFGRAASAFLVVWLLANAADLRVWRLSPADGSLPIIFHMK